MVIMMQEEVGEKILAGRNKKPHHSYLSLAMELACEDIEIVRYVGRHSFDPPPKVDSIVLKFKTRKNRDRAKEEALLKLWRYAFTHPRKTLMSNLRGSPYDLDRVKAWILECGYDEKVRAEAVGLEEWKFFK
jgi:16S rRNA (adenine1518-N6/adenine1519-N6)-dimethyltransferase